MYFIAGTERTKAKQSPTQTHFGIHLIFNLSFFLLGRLIKVQINWTASDFYFVNKISRPIKLKSERSKPHLAVFWPRSDAGDFLVDVMTSTELRQAQLLSALSFRYHVLRSFVLEAKFL